LPDLFLLIAVELSGQRKNFPPVVHFAGSGLPFSLTRPLEGSREYPFSPLSKLEDWLDLPVVFFERKIDPFSQEAQIFTFPSPSQAQEQVLFSPYVYLFFASPPMISE